MAKFIGTYKEFHDYIGPRIRNKINSVCAPYRKKKQRICQHCSAQGVTLESAHVYGRGRRVIIEECLNDYLKVDGIIECDVTEVERAIINKHYPIEESFLFLCKPCHRLYDKQEKSVKKLKPLQKSLVKRGGNDEFPKIDRIDGWAKKPRQINHQIVKTYLINNLTANSGIIFEDFIEKLLKKSVCKGVEERIIGNYRSLKTDSGNSHGKVFYEENGKVFMYDYVYNISMNAFSEHIGL